jgi:ABC-type polysaccharide/polyol phosphate transport system ATPase subunit
MNNGINKEIIEIKDLTKIYQLDQFGFRSFKNDLLKKFEKKNIERNRFLKAIDNLTLNILEGEKIGLLGKNGSGKSTLMRIISGITKPTQGEIILRDTVTSALQGSFAFQSDLTARDNINQFCAFKGLNFQKTREIFDTIVNFAECEKFVETPIKRFSSGMSMKLALSIAIHIPGQIMIFDEIFNYIDFEFKEKVKLFIKKKIISEEKTLILVSHDHDLIKDLCTKVLLLEKGKIKFFGNTGEGLDIYSKGNNL